MLDFIGTIITAALMMLVVNALTTFMDIPRSARLTLAALIGLWIGLAAAIAAAGMLAISKPFPVVAIFVAAPLIAAGIATAWPAARDAMLSVPMPVMIGLNVVRVFAVLFLLLAVEGRLSGPFPYSAGWGDIVTGVLAVPLLWLAKADNIRYTTAITAWNLFGAADLVAAIALGVTSADGSPLQLFAAPGSAAMQDLPWSFVPTVLVPIWLILHAIVAVQLVRRVKPGQPAKASARIG
jgi:hypothetical protein